MRIRHVPGLDGLRGVAVVGVLLFHANGLLRGGYLGVDLFFVLSGYLITSILIVERRATGGIDLRAFWVRRARRLLPALLALVPAVALYARFVPGADRKGIRADALATLAYVANWRAILAKRSYWEMFAAPSPLEHTWSLAIEEQFYVVWPLVAAAALGYGKGKSRALLAVSIVLAAASALAMAFLYDGSSSTRIYLGTDTRGAAILLGAAYACVAADLPDPPPSRVRSAFVDALGVAAAVGLGIAWCTLEGRSDFLYRGGFWITEIGCLVLVHACARNGRGIVARALSFAPLRAIGTLSYGVYLWHWPVYVVLTEERVPLSRWPLLALRLAVTFVIAYASYVAIERPIRSRGIRGPSWLVVPSAFAAACAIVVVATTGGTPPAGAGDAMANFVPTPTPPPPPSTTSPRQKPFAPRSDFPDASELVPNTRRILVLGDSVALSLGGRMFWSQIEAGPYFVVQRAIGDCSILDGIVPVRSMGGEPHGNGNCARSWVADVRELHPDATVVVLGGAYFSMVKGEGRWRPVCDPLWGGPYRERLASLLRDMAPDAGHRFVTLAAYPVGKWQTPTRDDDVDCYNRILRDAAEASGADVIDLNAYACPGGVCTLTSRGEKVRPDGLHFDGKGAEETALFMFRAIEGGGGGVEAGAY